MNPICVQRYIKRKMRYSLRYKQEDMYDMYLEKAAKYEIIHKEKVEKIKTVTLRRTMLNWDWIERRGEGKQAYYIRVDDPPKIEFSDLYYAVMRKYKKLRGKSWRK